MVRLACELDVGLVSDDGNELHVEKVEHLVNGKLRVAELGSRKYEADLVAKEEVEIEVVVRNLVQQLLLLVLKIEAEKLF